MKAMLVLAALALPLAGCSTVTTARSGDTVTITATGSAMFRSMGDVMEMAHTARALACATVQPEDKAEGSVQIASASELSKTADDVAGWWPKHTYSFSVPCK